MLKIDEKVDLSREVLDIDIESPIFEEMLDNLNSQIKACIKKVFDNEFVGAEISLKMNIQIPNDYKEFPSEDPVTGKMKIKTYKYRRLTLAHKATSTLKKQFVQDGTFDEERELKQNSDGSFGAFPIENPQISFEDLEEGV